MTIFDYSLIAILVAAVFWIIELNIALNKDEK